MRGWSVDIVDGLVRYCHDIFHEIGCITSHKKLPRKGEINVAITWSYGHISLKIGNTKATISEYFYGRPKCKTNLYIGGIPEQYT